MCASSERSHHVPTLSLKHGFCNDKPRRAAVFSPELPASYCTSNLGIPLRRQTSRCHQRLKTLGLLGYLRRNMMTMRTRRRHRPNSSPRLCTMRTMGFMTAWNSPLRKKERLCAGSLTEFPGVLIVSSMLYYYPAENNDRPVIAFIEMAERFSFYGSSVLYVSIPPSHS